MKFRVTLNVGENPKNEWLGKTDFEGEATNEAAAVEAWKKQNGLDGIGVENWPLVVAKAEEPKPEPKKEEKPKPPQ